MAYRCNYPKSALLLVLLAGSLPSCSHSESQEVDPSVAVAAVELSEAEGGVVPEALLPRVLPIPLEGDQPATSEDAAASVADAIPGAFTPEGCATAEVDGAVVTYVLDGCKPSHGVGRELHAHHGREGRHAMNASFTLTFAETDTGYAITIEGTRVKGDDEELSITGDATLDFDGTERVLEVSTDAEGTDRDGGAMTRTAHHVRSFDTETSCYSLDGEWVTTTPDDADESSGSDERSVSDFVQCGGACPGSGTVIGEIGHGMRYGGRHGGGGHRGGHGGCGRHGGMNDGAAGERGWADAAGVTVTVEFDGSAEAEWTASNGDSGVLPLDCEPAAE